MRKVLTSHGWLVVCGLLIASSPFILNLAAQGRGGGAAAPRPTINEPDDPMLRGFRWRSIGPVGQGARIDDFAVDEKNPSTYYIGYAVSGVWKTVNNGTTFENIFSTYGHNIADLTLAPSDPNVLYVATGEANNRQTTSYGDGLYKSTDAGATFTNIGFKDAQTLGRVIVHPKDPNTVWIAVGGHLYGPNKERGVYMTTDGGKTWNQTLKVDDQTGATEIIVDPANPLNLWAAMYQRQRTAWGFVGGGPGSGLYASTDGGKSWKRQSGNGLPNGTLGRIALDICRTNPNVLYAQIEVAMDKEPKAAPAPAPATPDPAAAAGRGGRGGRGGGQATLNPQYNGIWKSIDHGKTWQHVNNENQRPMYFSQIRVDPNDPNTIYVGGVNAQKSTDGGKTMFSIEPQKGHVDNHAIWIDPLNSKHVMYGDDGGLDVSYDGGETFESIRNMGVGLAYHSSVGMGHPYMVCTGLQDNGSWCGPSSVRSNQGIRMWDWMSVGGGDGFQNVIDPKDEKIFVTESQNAGIVRYDRNTGTQRQIKPSTGGGGGRGGGGGAGGAGGGGGRGNVLNEAPAGSPVVFNWNAPMMLSPHGGNLYLGGHQFFTSRDMGDSWTISQEMGKKADLTRREIMGVSYALPSCTGGAGGGRGGGGGGGGGGIVIAGGGGGAAGAAPAAPQGGPGMPCILSKNDGYVGNEFGSLTEIAESPVVPGVLWGGTDDGNINVSRDAGYTWTEVGKNIPGVNHEYYVSGLEASYFDAGTAYAALDGHRHDDLKPYIFKTTDYGQTWTPISSNLPAVGNVNAIRQDPVNRNLLFAPTERGFYVSRNEGKSWSRFMPNLPLGRYDEVVVHPREHDLVLSGHGYSVWIMDDITALEQMAADPANDATLLKPRDAVQWKNDFARTTEVPGEKFWQGENAPRGTAIAYVLKTAATDATIAITNTANGQLVRTCAASKDAGLTRFQWTYLTDTAVSQMFTGGGGGRGGGGGGGAAAPAPAGPTPPDVKTTPCDPQALAQAVQIFLGGAGGGRGGGGGGGGGFGGGGGGGTGPGVYRVTLTVGGKEVGSQTFRVLEDVWLNEK